MLARIRPSFLLLLALALLLSGFPPVQAQVHGVPASVSSFGFGGSTSMTPGVAASVTSLGPNGFGNSHRVFGNCCANAFFPANNPPRIFVSHRRHMRGAFFPGVPVYSAPYYPQVVVVQPEDLGEEDDNYAAGPTVFERHGSRARVRTREVEPEPVPAPAATTQPAEPEPVVPQPSTVLVFKDGHQAEIQNYAIVADTLFDIGEGRTHKIQLADLDLPATRKVNDDRGVDFQVPSKGN
jgi:hypothetical protein